MSCSLCAIVAGDADAHRVYEGEDVIAFLDENPAVHGHALVAPRDHDADALDGAGDAVAAATRRVARALETVLGCDGVSAFYTTPTLVGDVTHPHVHVLPRDRGDDVHLALERSTLDDDAGALAERVRERV
ncbi:MAG: HIT family protein [Halarchaeum sp.]